MYFILPLAQTAQQIYIKDIHYNLLPEHPPICSAFNSIKQYISSKLFIVTFHRPPTRLLSHFITYFICFPFPGLLLFYEALIVGCHSSTLSYKKYTRRCKGKEKTFCDLTMFNVFYSHEILVRIMQADYDLSSHIDSSLAGKYIIK